MVPLPHLPAAGDSRFPRPWRGPGPRPWRDRHPPRARSISISSYLYPT